MKEDEVLNIEVGAASVINQVQKYLDQFKLKGFAAEDRINVTQ